MTWFYNKATKTHSHNDLKDGNYHRNFWGSLITKLAQSKLRKYPNTFFLRSKFAYQFFCFGNCGQNKTKVHGIFWNIFLTTSSWQSYVIMDKEQVWSVSQNCEKSNNDDQEISVRQLSSEINKSNRVRNSSLNNEDAYTACAFDIHLNLTPLRQARQFIKTCGTYNHLCGK